MAGNLFKSPKRAMVFVGMTMFSVAMLVGSEDNEGALVAAANDIQRGAATPDNHASARPRDEGGREERSFGEDIPRPIARDFAAEEDLIDDASGFDPTPNFDEEFDNSPVSDESPE